MAISEIELDALAAGDDVATDLITARHYQKIKIGWGADGTFNDVTSTATNPFPVALSDTDNAVLDAIQAAVEGTLTVGSHAVTNAGTFAVQATLDAETTKVIGTVNIAAGQSITADLGANNDVTVTSGTITANLGATDNAVLDQIELNTSGNTSHYRNIDANAEASIKGSAGTLKWLHAINATAAKAYLHLYDATTASVTPGTTTPDYTFAIPTQGDTNGAGFVLPAQIEFSTAITLVCTTTLDGSTGDPGTNGVIVNAGYT